MDKQHIEQEMRRLAQVSIEDLKWAINHDLWYRVNVPVLERLTKLIGYYNEGRIDEAVKLLENEEVYYE